MKNVIHYFIKYSTSGNVLLLLILIFGYMGLQSLQTTFFPEIPSRSISIRAVYPGTSPSEIEESVVLKIEDNLQGLSGVDRVTSSSSENFASLRVEIKQDADIDLVLTDVKNAVDRITSFPDGLESLDVFKDEALGFAITFSISGDVKLGVLKDLARKAERDLLTQKGISKVLLSGYPEEEIAILFKEDQLTAFQLTFDQVLQKVRGTNVEITGGTIVGVGQELKIRSRNKAYTAAGMQDIIIKSDRNGKIVRLGDVADVKDTWADVPNRNFYNGKPSVTITVQNTNDEDIIFITDYVRKYLEDFNEKNSHVQAYTTRDSSVLIRQRIDLLVRNGVIGFVLVFVFLALFLHYRLAFWVALSIPISFAGMFILASFFGITINVISLFGMITVIGILVDDGVVISENIFQHYERGMGRMEAAVKGTVEVMPAIISAILTTMVVFSSFFFIDGRLGDFFGEMAFIVIATLLFSLIEGLFILPAHVAHSKALDREAKPNMLTKTTTRFLSWVRDVIYAKSLEFTLKNRALTVSIMIGLLIVTMGALSGGIIKATFFPFIDGDDLAVEIKMPAGTTEDVTTRNLEHIEKAIWAVNEELKMDREDGKDVILSADRRLGPSAKNVGRINIKLLDSETRNLSSLKVASAIREKAGPIAGTEELNYGRRQTFGKPVSIALIGDNMNEVRGIGEELKTWLRKLSDLKDVSDNDPAGPKEVNVTLKEKARLLGLTEASVMKQIRQGFFGAETQRLQRGLDEIKVWIRYDEPNRSTIGNLEQMKIRTAQGETYELQELADFKTGRGVVNVNHMDGKREIRIQADVSNQKVSVSDILSSIQSDILPKLLAGHPDVTYSMEGQSREQAKSINSMGKVMPVIMLLMIAIIVLTFRSFSQTFMVLLQIPFAFIGVAWGHWIHGLPISLFSILGMIALIGILVNDSLVFVGAFNTNIKGGM
ncbi:MAG TPA: efflux RND transporter permease subunit, partial [Bacteroidetes bacterium]|nr:efflux RND transporter permease subunit [Bacteroidota bacterium]